MCCLVPFQAKPSERYLFPETVCVELHCNGLVDVVNCQVFPIYIAQTPTAGRWWQLNRPCDTEDRWDVHLTMKLITSCCASLIWRYYMLSWRGQ